MKTRKPLAVTPPYWLGLIASGIGIGISAVLHLIKLDAPYPPMTNRDRLLICVFLMLVSSARYAFYSKHLILKVFVFPVLIIPWNKVSGAAYIPACTNPACMIISILPCVRYTATCGDVKAFCRKNMLKTIRISLPKRREAEYIEAVQGCIGEVSGWEGVT